MGKRGRADAASSWRLGEESGALGERRDAGHKLHTFFLTQYACCKFSAKDLCTAMYFAEKAGTSGADFAKYALAPPAPGHNASEGRYQKHLDTVLPVGNPLYSVDTPVNEKRA
eukprot:13233591-Heterocapsa_arctica.AAC.1